VESTVLKVTHAGSCFIVKAGGDGNHHIARELEAHRRWLAPWTSKGRAPALEYANADAKLLVTRYLPGQLVLGSGHDDDPRTYRQAGGLLATFHAQEAVTDGDYELTANERALEWLSGPHRIAAATAELLRTRIQAWPTPPATLTPTHGDWQPRNWLINDHIVSVIDFGRTAMRPPMTDFARLAVQEFRRDPSLEAAFVDGYGSDPREKQAWYRTLVREAIGTAAWAHQVGDERFEAQGHRMIAEVLAMS
jgi:Ser/Thr protein kinase RdoA (MazF antagonist)